MNKLIEIIISPTGEAKVQTTGFTGESCTQASRYIEQALGNKLTEVRTPEFFQAQENAAQEREHS